MLFLNNYVSYYSCPKLLTGLLKAAFNAWILTAEMAIKRVVRYALYFSIFLIITFK